MGFLWFCGVYLKNFFLILLCFIFILLFAFLIAFYCCSYSLIYINLFFYLPLFNLDFLFFLFFLSLTMLVSLFCFCCFILQLVPCFGFAFLCVLASFVFNWLISFLASFACWVSLLYFLLLGCFGFVYVCICVCVYSIIFVIICLILYLPFV